MLVFCKEGLPHVSTQHVRAHTCTHIHTLTLFYSVQVQLDAVSSCTQWQNNARLGKLSNVILVYIRSVCECDYPTLHLHQSRFLCFDDVPNSVTFRASLVAYSNWTVSELNNILESWLESHSTIAISTNETLNIDTRCPILITSYEAPHCLEITTTDNAITNEHPAAAKAVVIGASSAGGALLLLIVLATILLCVLAVYRRYIHDIAHICIECFASWLTNLLLAVHVYSNGVLMYPS